MAVPPPASPPPPTCRHHHGVVVDNLFERAVRLLQYDGQLAVGLLLDLAVRVCVRACGPSPTSTGLTSGAGEAQRSTAQATPAQRSTAQPSAAQHGTRSHPPRPGWSLGAGSAQRRRTGPRGTCGTPRQSRAAGAAACTRCVRVRARVRVRVRAHKRVRVRVRVCVRGTNSGGKYFSASRACVSA
jgi:hypothetical protein